jgi:hypothetical protein
VWAQDNNSANAKLLPPHIAGAWGGTFTDDISHIDTEIFITFLQNGKTIEGIWQQNETTPACCFMVDNLVAVGTLRGSRRISRRSSCARLQGDVSQNCDQFIRVIFPMLNTLIVAPSKLRVQLCWSVLPQ